MSKGPPQYSSSDYKVPLRKVVGFLDRHFAVLLILSFAAIHLLYHRVPVDSRSQSWSGENYNIATSIVHGKGFADPFAPLETGPSAFVAPPFPYLLAGVFWLAGTNTPRAARLSIFLQALIFAGTVCLLYAIVQAAFSTFCARLAALIWLISPNRIGLTSTYFLSEVGLSVFSLLLTVFALIRFKETPARNAATLAGLAIGFAILCLPVMAVALPLFAHVLYALARRRTSHPLIAPAIALTLCSAILTPWMVRNYVVFGTVVFIKSNFSQALYDANRDEKGEGFMLLYTSKAERALMQRMGEIPYMRFSLQRALAWIRGHKREFLVRCLRRGFMFWVANPARGLKRWIWNLYQIPFLLSSTLGLWRHWGRSPITKFCCAILITVPSVYYLTAFADEHRYRLPLEALLTVFASAALTPPLPGHREPRPTVLTSV